MWGHGQVRAGSGQEQVAGTCECGKEPSGSITFGEFFDQIRNGQLLKKDSAAWSKQVSKFDHLCLFFLTSQPTSPTLQRKISFIVFLNIKHSIQLFAGLDSSVGIATSLQAGWPRDRIRWVPDFPRPSRPPMWPTQSPIQGIVGHFWE